MTQYASVEVRIKKAYEAMSKGDIHELLDLYMQDAIIQSASQPPVVGLDAIRNFWVTTFAQFEMHVVPEIQEVSDFGEVFIVRGRAVGELVLKEDGAPIQVDTWFMQVYKRGVSGQVHFWRGANGPNASK